MRFPTGFMMRVAKADRPPGQRSGMMFIIIRRPYSHLEGELLNAFKRQAEVKVIVDRRYAERRQYVKPIAMDHRRFDRRSSSSELVKALISI